MVLSLSHTNRERTVLPIEAIEIALPTIKHSAADLAAATGADEDFIRRKVGVESRYILGPRETGVSLSAEACTRLFDKFPTLRDKIDLLVCVTQTPDQRLPQNSAAIASVLELGNSIASFDISLGCSGFVYALSVVEGFLTVTGLKHAVLVTCDPYSRIIDPRDKATNCVFGDAATATWICQDGAGGRIVSTDFGTDGSAGDAISVPAGGAVAPFVSVLGLAQPEPETLRLHMNGRAVFNFVNARIPQSIRICLEKASLKIEDVNWFALHQGSTYMLEVMTKRAGIPPDRVRSNMKFYGNTVSSSVPLIIYDLQEMNNLSGKRVLVSGFGVGLSWATAILEFGSK